MFPWLERQLGSLPKRYKKLTLVVELVNIETHLPRPVTGMYGGRSKAHRTSLARSFLAKMVFNIETTSALRERLLTDSPLRSICGGPSEMDVPSESTFSRAFQEFAQMQFPNRVHEALIAEGYEGELIGHISRDSTAIEAREKPVTKKKEPASGPKKRGRSTKAEALTSATPEFGVPTWKVDVRSLNKGRGVNLGDT